MTIRPGDSANATALRLSVILGNPRASRSGGAVSHWFLDLVRQRADFVTDVIDAREPPPPEQASARLAESDAFVVITPEYNHSFPGVLKTLIDAHYVEWHAKPVGFVSYGGISGGLRAIEQLRLVFAELHTVTVRDTVSFHRVEGQFDQRGEPVDEAGCGAAGKRLLDGVAWWGTALRAARAVHPYG
ncbi:NAD(P)H-dependent oxidoreductase [Spiractinospora alimapuensis]|uniref:NADPH-dependent FMN reductase n=1 Tax=Spiractinospora alimapuensis TaxID=2820884 RepID=UPI001F3433C8|nr:NAD(P)H-dependent oxidoreductase [Spiractinospora alimapuensis]QVQ50231.1 NAD(P)H-dependent oxidoreductase [Spiractinospora alimapuensis]